MPVHTSRSGTTNADVPRTPGMPLKDESDATPIKMDTTGSNLWKQSPGMNTQLVPPVPDPKR